MSVTRRSSGSGTGAAGRGIASVVRTSGTGAAGTTDTYTITYTDATTSTFDVHNGADGTGGTGGTQVKVDGANVTTLPISSAAITPDDIGAIAKSLGLAKGDLLVYTASGALARLAKGADGTVLTADSTTTTGLRWA